MNKPQPIHIYSIKKRPQKPNPRRRFCNQRRGSTNRRRRLRNPRRWFGFKTLLFPFYIKTKSTFHPLKKIIILYPKGFKNQVVARVARRCKSVATVTPVTVSVLYGRCKSGMRMENPLIERRYEARNRCDWSPKRS